VYLNCVQEVQKLDNDFTFSLLIQGPHENHSDEFYPKIEEITQRYQDLIIDFEMAPKESIHSSLESTEVTELPVHFGTPKVESKNVSLTLHNSESKSEINDSVIDYLLVKCPKIGHSINLIKHSAFFDDAKKKNICVEASIEPSPHSRQSMKFTPDHGHLPLVTFLQKANTQQISNEEYNSEVKFVTWDFFTASLAMEFDLYDFKKVCINSITSSNINEDAKQNLKKGWELRWNKYIKQIAGN